MFGERLRLARKGAGPSLRGLAERFGGPPERAQRFERLCLRVLSEGLASEARVAEFLGVSMRKLEAMADARAPA